MKANHEMLVAERESAFRITGFLSSGGSWCMRPLTAAAQFVPVNSVSLVAFVIFDIEKFWPFVTDGNAQLEACIRRSMIIINTEWRERTVLQCLPIRLSLSSPSPVTPMAIRNVGIVTSPMNDETRED